MVEKVFISPNRVRAYGNIVNMKTGDDFTLVNSELTVTTDTVDGAEMTVFQFEVEGGISIALVSSSSTCNVGDNVLLTATVLDDNAPVEAAEVTFKVGETVLGTDETDANGVATYTYAASTVGSFSFTASYQDSTSPVVSVSVNHSYSLAFSQSSYVATDGSAVLSLTLLEDNVAMSGASITVSGSDGSVYNGITNSQGLAEITVSNITGTVTFTASYSNVTDTCTVTVSSYLFYDDCSADLTSQYADVTISSSSNSILKSYDSTENAYKVYGSGGDAFRALLIPNIRGLDNIRISLRAKLASTSAYNQLFIGVSDSITQTSKPYTADMCRIRGDNRSDCVYNDSEVSGSGASTNVRNKYVTLLMEKTGTTITMKVYDTDGTTLLRTYTYNSVNNYTNPYYWFGINTRNTSDIKYIKEIKVEPI